MAVFWFVMVLPIAVVFASSSSATIGTPIFLLPIACQVAAFGVQINGLTLLITSAINGLIGVPLTRGGRVPRRN